MATPRNQPAHCQFPTYALEDCPFETVFVDVTHRCNMGCRNCYIPNRTIPDLDAAWLEEVFARLPRGRVLRLAGAEPTMRDDLPDLIRAARANGHHPAILTNGLKLGDRAYLRELKRAGVQIVYLSMNGAFDDELYYAVDAMRCAEAKTVAFDNLRSEHVYTALGITVVRDRNESAIPALLKATGSARNVRELHLRSVGPIGRYMRNAPLTLEELEALFCLAAGILPGSLESCGRSARSRDVNFNRLRVQFTQWPDLDSTTRGRLTPEGRIAPAFEHGIANEGGY